MPSAPAATPSPGGRGRARFDFSAKPAAMERSNSKRPAAHSQGSAVKSSPGGSAKKQAKLFSFFGKATTPSTKPKVQPGKASLTSDATSLSDKFQQSPTAPNSGSQASPSSTLASPPPSIQTTVVKSVKTKLDVSPDQAVIAPTQTPARPSMSTEPSARATKTQRSAVARSSSPPLSQRARAAARRSERSSPKRAREVLIELEESSSDESEEPLSEDEYCPDDEELEAVKREESEDLDQDSESEVPDESDGVLESEPESDGERRSAAKTRRKRAPSSASKTQKAIKPFSPTSAHSELDNFAARTSRTPPKTVAPKSNGPLSQSEAGAGATSNAGRFRFLADLRDSHRRKPSDPNYDPTTLHIPTQEFEKLSPFEKQYWTIKKDNFDTILFFKKGKFYELYEQDAFIANREFQWKITERVNMSMAGVPESTMIDWATRFLALGFKVARADERESALAMQMRQRKEAKGGQPNKKLPKIIERKLTTIYTKGTLMGDFVVGDLSSYIMAIKESDDGDAYGIVFADTATAEFYFCNITNDQRKIQLETILVQIMPKEFVLCRNQCSKELLALIKTNVPHADLSWLDEHHEGWRPDFVKSMVDSDNYNLRQTRLEELISADLTWAAFGGLVSYFQKLLVDKHVLPQGRFETYDPVKHGAMLVMDGQTLQNLEILTNNVDRTSKGSLFELLCHTVTPFGKRLFRDEVAILMKSLPDLERLLARVHAGSCKLKDFLELLDAFARLNDTAHRWVADNRLNQVTAVRLQQLLTPGKALPRLEEPLERIKASFDHEKALADGIMEPTMGALSDFDAATTTLDTLTKELDVHLQKAKNRLKSNKVPMADTKGVPSDWRLLSSTKNFKRYHSPEVLARLQPLLEAEETQRQIRSQFYATTLCKMDSYAEVFSAAVATWAEVDCLLSLYRATHVFGDPCCRPVFVNAADAGQSSGASMQIESSRHPCMSETGIVTDFIPNDIRIGGDAAPVVLLTGPNMGGKSTLLRQTCITVIMAQLGCWVPAARCVLSPVDRIFTRIGANDNIMAGRCRTLFATHYHMLTEEFQPEPLVANFNMACIVDEGSKRDVTFLYKLVQGVCSKSYGMNVAAMAGLSDAVIQAAEHKARECEKSAAFRSCGLRQKTQV
ncbi:uncharacterized protein MONBRDRAFT_29248 [Monosiga brevicollis MX1]|uniref:DNA mismatch repair protein n=1 Tax=Monosiga brevicollis TaxID=81824 RepID=A9VAJ6_MONBE|nr:uncharacterized protein MONBRDRAFT_29248 [Monosiga brevicollis MX1]EDQ85496.1 predicted protein [Monosiga brevicollis MX1]|eukprot:XP_001749687.1 hypothetical protein [Monosiga brevicollis MX1]